MKLRNIFLFSVYMQFLIKPYASYGNFCTLFYFKKKKDIVFFLLLSSSPIISKLINWITIQILHLILLLLRVNKILSPK